MNEDHPLEALSQRVVDLEKELLLVKEHLKELTRRWKRHRRRQRYILGAVLTMAAVIVSGLGYLIGTHLR